MKEIFKTIKWNTTISALVCIGAGIALFVWPELFTLMACRAIAMLLVVVGVVHLLSYLLERREAFRQQADLAIGAVLFALGLWMTLSPGFFISLIPLVLGAVVLVHGIQDIRYGLSLKKTAYEYWWSAVIFGIFSVLFGLTMIANPFGSASALTMLVGVALIYDGISDLWIVSRLSRSARRFSQNVADHFQSFEDAKDGVVYTAKEQDVTEENMD
jgi:uncharacterized membrane protein HdeD (DUF308 family)